VQCAICRRHADTHTCGPCVEHLSDVLITIQREVEILSSAPSMQQAHGARSGTLASHRAPARLDVLTLRDPRTLPDTDGTLGVLNTLMNWTARIRQDRDLRWPRRATITSERQCLHAHLDWAARQPWIGTMNDQLRNLLAQLQRANGTAPEPPAGRCYLPINGTECGGPIWLDHANGHAHCGRCANTWDGARLAHLKWELDRALLEAKRPLTEDGRPWLTVGELAQDLGITPNAVRIRLSRAGHRATRGHYHPDALDPISA
jgi:hypothetical protein